MYGLRARKILFIIIIICEQDKNKNTGIRIQELDFCPLYYHIKDKNKTKGRDKGKDRTRQERNARRKTGQEKAGKDIISIIDKKRQNKGKTRTQTRTRQDTRQRQKQDRLKRKLIQPKKKIAR